MALLPSRRRAAQRAAADEAAFRKAVAAVADTINEAALREGAVTKAYQPGNAALAPTSTWSNLGGTTSRLIAQATQNLSSRFQRPADEVEQALAEQGLTWGAPFPPGRPLNPFWGYRQQPRTWDYQVGQNTQLIPRWGRTSFPTLRALYDAYDVAQICVRHLINDVRSLDYQFVPPANVAEDATDDIEAAEKFFRYPDRRQPFRAWLAEYLQDVLRYDAGTLYVRRNEGGDPIALEVVNGTTMIPLLDYFGRVARDEDREVDLKIEELGGTWDGDTVPAYLQIIMGIPWAWLAADDIIYQPLNPMPDSQYGLAPLEAVLLTANTDIRFQWHFLQYFTEGSIPAGFMEAPPDLSDPNQLAEWQDTWDSLIQGDQAKLRQIRWVPSGSKFQPAKEHADEFDAQFPLYLMRRTAAAFGVTPNDLGFTEDVNRSTGEVQVDIQFRVGTLPIVRHLEDLINAFIAEDLGLKAVIQFDIGREIEDRLKTAQAEEVYIRTGVYSPDEVRMRLGKRISRERPTPRVFDNTRSGPIPLLALDSLSGKVDPMTYGPAKDQPLIDHPFVSAPGVAPIIGSDEYRASQNATANMQRNMLIENVDDNAPGRAMLGDGTVRTEPGRPDPVSPDTPGDGPADTKTPDAQDGDTEKALAEAVDIISLLLDLAKDGGLTAAGVTTQLGATGVDLLGLDDDEEDDPEVKKALRQWRENSRNRLRKGQPPRLFTDIPPEISGPVWKQLEHATTREEVDAAFEAVKGKVPAPSGA